jgi:hypothetical protein
MRGSQSMPQLQQSPHQCDSGVQESTLSAGPVVGRQAGYHTLTGSRISGRGLTVMPDPVTFKPLGFTVHACIEYPNLESIPAQLKGRPKAIIDREPVW